MSPHDYFGLLNDHLVRQSFPLPLISFEFVQSLTFTSNWYFSCTASITNLIHTKWTTRIITEEHIEHTVVDQSEKDITEIYEYKK